MPRLSRDAEVRARLQAASDAWAIVKPAWDQAEDPISTTIAVVIFAIASDPRLGLDQRQVRVVQALVPEYLRAIARQPRSGKV